MASGRFFTSYRSDQKLVKSGWTRFWIVVLAAGLIYLPFVLTTASSSGCR